MKRALLAATLLAVTVVPESPVIAHPGGAHENVSCTADVSCSNGTHVLVGGSISHGVGFGGFVSGVSMSRIVHAGGAHVETCLPTWGGGQTCREDGILPLPGATFSHECVVAGVGWQCSLSHN